MPCTLFQYLYRDADNYKAFGSLVLEGPLSEAELERVRELLADDGFFIAEQLHIPSLYHQLYEWSGGPTEADHCWHQFAAIAIAAEADVPEDAHRWGGAREFLRNLEEVEEWRPELSPHFWLGVDSLEAAARIFGYPLKPFPR